MERRHFVERVEPIVRHARLVAGEREDHAERVGAVAVVVDDEDSARCA